MPFPEPKTENLALPKSGGTVLLPALARLGLPVLIFGAAFAVLSGLLTFLVSPDRFPVHAGDSIVRLRDLRQEQEVLENDEAELLEERANLKSQESAPILSRAQELADTFPPLGQALQALEEVRSSFVSATDPIALPAIEFRSDGNVLRIGGEVKDSGGRSVQILAAFVDALRSVPVFERVSEPEYAPQELEGGGSLSPFTLTLTLKDA